MRRLHIQLAMLSIPTVLAAACSSERAPLPNPERGTLRGTIVDASGAGVEDVAVFVVEGREATTRTFTDSSGAFVFDPAPSGNIEIVANDGVGNGALLDVHPAVTDVGVVSLETFLAIAEVVDRRGVGFDERVAQEGLQLGPAWVVDGRYYMLDVSREESSIVIHEIDAQEGEPVERATFPVGELFVSTARVSKADPFVLFLQVQNGGAYALQLDDASWTSGALPAADFDVRETAMVDDTRFRLVYPSPRDNTGVPYEQVIVQNVSRSTGEETERRFDVPHDGFILTTLSRVVVKEACTFPDTCWAGVDLETGVVRHFTPAGNRPRLLHREDTDEVFAMTEFWSDPIENLETGRTYVHPNPPPETERIHDQTIFRGGQLLVPYRTASAVGGTYEERVARFDLDSGDFFDETDRALNLAGSVAFEGRMGIWAPADAPGGAFALVWTEGGTTYELWSTNASDYDVHTYPERCRSFESHTSFAFCENSVFNVADYSRRRTFVEFLLPLSAQPSDDYLFYTSGSLGNGALFRISRIDPLVR